MYGVFSYGMLNYKLSYTIVAFCCINSNLEISLRNIEQTNMLIQRKMLYTKMQSIFLYRLANLRLPCLILHLDFNFYAAGQFKFHQGINGLRR